jgi:DNA repair protein RadC
MLKKTVYAAIKAGNYEKAIELLALEVCEPTPIDGPAAAFALLKAHCFDRKESFFIVHLDGANRTKGYEILTVGLKARCLINPQEVFRSALKADANAIILAHNHPSGDPTPSDKDIALTKRLAECGQLLDIPVLDHVVVGDGNSYWSMQEQGGW